MNYESILTQLDEHNEVGIILCKKYKAKKLFIIVDKDEEQKFKLLQNSYKEILPNCILKRVDIDIGNREALVKLLDENKECNLLINLTGGARINSLFLLKEADIRSIDSIYVDLLNKKSYFFKRDSEIVYEDFEDLSIEEVTKIAGAGIINDSNYLFSKKDVIDISQKIVTNIDLWEKYKNKLYDTKIFCHDYKESSTVEVNLYELNEEEINILNKVVNYIKNLGSIDYFKNKNKMIIKFKNNYLKGFIFKSGTWLEVITKLIIEEIRDIDEVKSGVEFYWRSDDKLVKNELDVVAVKDSILLCISCKDSDKYDENALNELEVYSDKIGGENVIKILVSTKDPIKKTVIKRAKEMNINLVVLNNNLNEFREKLRVIVNGIKK